MQAQETKPAGMCSPSERQSCSGIPLPETSGSLLASAGPDGNGTTQNCEQAAGTGTFLLPFNAMLKLKTYRYLPPPCHPSSLQLIIFALAPFGTFCCCREGSVCSSRLSTRGTSHSSSCNSPASTSLIKPGCTTRRTGGSLSLSLAPSSSPSIQRFDVSGCDDNTLTKLVISLSWAG